MECFWGGWAVTQTARGLSVDSGPIGPVTRHANDSPPYIRRVGLENMTVFGTSTHPPTYIRRVGLEKYIQNDPKTEIKQIKSSTTRRSTFKVTKIAKFFQDLRRP